ncbi:MAG: phosphoglucosamine mutase [Thermoplasmata archaeon]|nr:MAG: phosphoglucosamine mutase [Thermoplasmata archaeon]
MDARLFGTNGIRGVVNQDMNCELALGVGKAWGTYLKKKFKEPIVAIGTDARLSNDMLKTSVISGLLSTGCNVTDIGMLPTPTIQYTVKKKDFHSGIAITASHNPPEFNGIKGIERDGTEFPREVEEEIEKIYLNRRFEVVSWDKVGKLSSWDGAVDLYINDIVRLVDRKSIKERKLHVVLDCGNGVGSITIPLLLKKLGCKITELYCKPNGRFPNRSSEPTPENLVEIMEKVPKIGADFGVALDGDADRSIFIDEKGNYIWGDKSLTLMAKYMLLKNKGGKIVTPVTTSQCIDDIAKKYNGTVIRTRVGSPTVARVMMKEKAIFGGEENGGLIFPEFQYCRDSGITITRMLEILAREDKTLGELIEEIPRYEMIKTKVFCPNERKEEVLAGIYEKIKEDDRIKNIDRTDGLKIFTGEGWILIRPSGTEPIYRIYGEGKRIRDIERLLEDYKKLVEEIINS